MNDPNEITLFLSCRGRPEAEAQLASLTRQFPSASVRIEVLERIEEESPSTLATPAVRLSFADRADIWLTGYLDDPTAVAATMAVASEERSSSHG